MIVFRFNMLPANNNKEFDVNNNKCIVTPESYDWQNAKHF